MLKNALEFLESRLGHTERWEVGGDTYFAGGGQVYPVPLPTLPRSASCLSAATLAGLVAYMEGNVDNLSLSDCLVTIAAQRVSLCGKLRPTRDRECFVAAKYSPSFGQCVDKTLPLREMVSALETHFEDTAFRAALLESLSKVQVTGLKVQRREGMGSRVTAEQGVMGDGWENLQPVVELAPFRTFPEVPQVPSRFLVEVTAEGEEENAAVKLRCVDGGAWLVPTTQRLAKHLEGLMSGLAHAPTLVY